MDALDRHSAIYFPLNPPNASIRLLRIFREKSSSIIIGQLGVFPLDPANCPAFIAVSYAWCEKVYPKAISLNRYRFPVLQSLYPFLELICDHQDFSSDFWWWIDSICINQDDTRERCSQVELMARIWRQAQKAIV
jgi:hypothetical protein